MAGRHGGAILQAAALHSSILDRFDLNMDLGCTYT